MYKKICVVLIAAACTSIDASAQGTSTEAQGKVPSPQNSKLLSTEPVTGGEDHKVKDKLTNLAFVEKTTMMELTELAVSRMAMKKSASQPIRDFAGIMVKSLTSMNQQMHDAAKANGIAVAGKPDRSHNEVVDKFTSLSGVDFDKSYIGFMRQDQDEMLALFENAAGEQSLSAELRDFATKTLDTLRNHQLLAHNL